MAWRDERDGEGLWSKLANRNKRTVVARPQGRRRPRARAAARRRRPRARRELPPGRAGAPRARARRAARPQPALVITRVTGFGQDGPYADRPGFATIAEAMSGFAAINGEPDGQPLLPPIALTDEVTGLAAAFATMVALHSGTGQVVDVNLLETMFHLMGPLPSLYALRGEQQPRLGAGLPYTVPRGTYRCARRQVDRRVDEQRLGRRAGDDAARPRRRRAVHDVRRPCRAPRRARGGDGGVVRARARRPRRWPRSPPPTPRPGR